MENGNVRTFKRFDIIEISNENDHDKKVIIDNLKLLENSKEDIVAKFLIKDKLYEDIAPFPKFYYINSRYIF